MLTGSSQKSPTTSLCDILILKSKDPHSYFGGSLKPAEKHLVSLHQRNREIQETLGVQVDLVVPELRWILLLTQTDDIRTIKILDLTAQRCW